MEDAAVGRPWGRSETVRLAVDGGLTLGVLLDALGALRDGGWDRSTPVAVDLCAPERAGDPDVLALAVHSEPAKPWSAVAVPALADRRPLHLVVGAATIGRLREWATSRGIVENGVRRVAFVSRAHQAPGLVLRPGDRVHYFLPAPSEVEALIASALESASCRLRLELDVLGGHLVVPAESADGAES